MKVRIKSGMLVEDKIVGEYEVSGEGLEFFKESIFFFEKLLLDLFFPVHGLDDLVFFRDIVLFFKLQRFLDFRADFKLVLDLFIGDFVDLGFVKVVPDELSRCKFFSNLYFLFHFRYL
jgi:hypothetical protein